MKRKEGDKGGQERGKTGREDKPTESSRKAVISPTGSSVTASKSEYIWEHPWLCPFNSTDLQETAAEHRGKLCGKSFLERGCE